MDEIDKHQWEAQYRRLAAVEELSEKNHLIHVYEEEYQRKMGAKPVWDLGNSHLALMADIQKLAKDKTADLIRHFFKMRDDWFQRQGWPLHELKKNISKVHADFIKRGTTTHHSNKDLRILVEVSCDECGSQFKWTGTTGQLLSDNKRICNNCLKEKNNAGCKLSNRG